MFSYATDNCRRQNIPMFYRVLIACDINDTAAAAQYLANAKVPFEVARRVLLQPHLRRSAKV